MRGWGRIRTSERFPRALFLGQVAEVGGGGARGFRGALRFAGFGFAHAGEAGRDGVIGVGVESLDDAELIGAEAGVEEVLTRGLFARGEGFALGREVQGEREA